MTGQETAAAAVTDEQRLANVRAVARVYTAKLEAARDANSEDQRFLTGTTHAYAALTRITRAVNGETDPVRLGIADPETTQAPAPEPVGLFDEGAQP